MIAGPSEQIAGRHVLVIDGVLDAGRTIAKAVSLIQAAGAASVQVAVILDKQRPDALAHADYVGFPIGNEFVIGYGMDDAGRYRGLPYIGKVPSSLKSRHECCESAAGSQVVSKRLQQPVQIIALGLGPAHLRGAAAQLFQNGARARQIGGTGNLDSGIAQGRGGAAQRIFRSAVLAAL